MNFYCWVFSMSSFLKHWVLSAVEELQTLNSAKVGSFTSWLLLLLSRNSISASTSASKVCIRADVNYSERLGRAYSNFIIVIQAKLQLIDFCFNPWSTLIRQDLHNQFQQRVVSTESSFNMFQHVSTCFNMFQQRAVSTKGSFNKEYRE